MHCRPAARFWIPHSRHCWSLPYVRTHTLAARPVVVPDSQEIRVRIGADGGEVKFSADSASVFGLLGDDEVAVRRYEHPTRLIAFDHGTFYDKVHDRLLWGERVNA